MSRVLRGLVLVIGLVLVAPTASPVAADPGLTATVAAAYFPRYDDAELHAIAHQRVSELAACECLAHGDLRPGTGEVVAYNTGFPDPVAQVVRRWQASSGHDEILSNRSYGRIGCAELVVGDTHWFACVVGTGALPPQPAPATPAPSSGVLLLPNTAMP